MAIEMQCTCITDNARWALIGALNTIRLMAEKNLQDLKEELKGKKPAPFQEMALKKLEGDLQDMKELRAELDKIPLCREARKERPTPRGTPW